MRNKFCFCLLALLICSRAAIAAIDDVPAWLRQAAAVTPPAYPKEVKAVVLHDETRKTVDDDGRITTWDYYAVRILARDGRGEAVARAGYTTGSEKIKEMRAWLLRPDGTVKNYGKKEMLDLAEVENDIYNESRVRVLSASAEADTGAVFGYEIKTEEKTIFSQFRKAFQSNVPVLLARLNVTLPNGWRAESLTFNHAKLEPVVNGNSYTWELTNQPQIEDEPASPSASALVTLVAVSLYAPPNKTTMLRAFASWKDVARYTAELSDPQAAFNDAMAAKARELTANAKTEFERIQAIGRYAQAVNYIAVSIDVGRGGGHRPHAATDVFSKNYGDCKDKANLMRALLKPLGIEAWPVIIYSGDPTFVRPEWPTPGQFNHCIIAVKVSDATNAPTVIKYPALGRLLIFDPTDEQTPVGDLPDHEQGSWALIGAGELGDLVKMPVTAPEANKLERTVEAALDASGNLTATIKESSSGQAAVGERRQFKHYAQPDYLKMTERWITRGAPGAVLSKVAPNDDAQAGKFALEVEFKAPAYAKTMRDKLMVFKPALVSRRSSLFLTKDKRAYPVVLESQAYSETTRIQLPAGFEVDEMPEAVELNHPFGNYAMTCEAKAGQLLFKRTLILRAGTIPVEQYPAVRSFFARVLAAEQAPVVLAKK
ncbi:MAG: DUF3857 domain-containing protein [Acidobacteria bacterium]|nr:DUF3857 domain-containing protein [Acidobacteriota bacterium]